MRRREHPLWILVAIYGGLAFMIGFVFGALREIVLIPRFGDEPGHWIEFPLVTVPIAIIGWMIGRRRAGQLGQAWAIGVGGVAVLLAIESIFALGVMGVTVSDYVDSFNIFKGALFPFGLAIMAAAPPVGSALARPSER
ncbi:MAG: hypothetical protein WA989_15145 [Henriciella sp.]|uniref:hypothetical protein n=1 Tax=Henriciella sp. TaxID=1968823 RepID=UPI003C792493